MLLNGSADMDEPPWRLKHASRINLLGVTLCRIIKVYLVNEVVILPTTWH